MLPSIGFVVVSFNLPEQTAHLCHRLTAMFGAPPIALHHDFGKCALDRSTLPSNVHVVEPWFNTGWGIFPVAEANLAALRLLYSVADPDWCVSLSTADYPIKSADRILSDLRDTEYDGFIDFREIVRPNLPPGYRRDESKSFDDPVWLLDAYDRYVACEISPNPLTRRLKWPRRPIRLRGPLVEQFLTPFTKMFRPYGGDHWYTLNRRAARVLSEKGDLFARLRRHYRKRLLPEESIYQTILCNRSDLHLKNDTRRYTDWAAGGAHPRYLEASDIPALLASPAHFARKFPNDPDLFRQLDQAVDASAAHIPASLLGDK